LDSEVSEEIPNYIILFFGFYRYCYCVVFRLFGCFNWYSRMGF